MACCVILWFWIIPNSQSNYKCGTKQFAFPGWHVHLQLHFPIWISVYIFWLLHSKSLIMPTKQNGGFFFGSQPITAPPSLSGFIQLGLLAHALSLKKNKILAVARETAWCLVRRIHLLSLRFAWSAWVYDFPFSHSQQVSIIQASGKLLQQGKGLSRRFKVWKTETGSLTVL